MMKEKDIQIVEVALDPESCRRWVADHSCGGQVVFTGAVRNHTGNRKVVRLEYEGYVPMAVKVLDAILERAAERFPIVKCAVHHRLGTLELGELAVVVAVSAAHRKEAFEACMYIIDELKKDVPIWKKEISDLGEEWVSPRP
jgi:molybdopterin synthase catalytic subunit